MNGSDRRASLWRRAPLSLARQPRLAAVVALVAGVLGFVAATPYLFLSSVSSASVSRQVDESCRGVGVDPAVGQQFGLPQMAGVGHVGALGLPNDFGTKANSRLGPAIQTKANTTPEFGPAGGDPHLKALIVHRTGYPEHLVPLEGGGPGVWVPDTLAYELGITVGDKVRAGANEALAPVSAIYADLYITRKLDNWSCAMTGVLGMRTFIDMNARVPPAVFVSDGDFDHLFATPMEMFDENGTISGTLNYVEMSFARVEWPFADLPSTLSDAHGALDALAAIDNATKEVRASDPSIEPTAPSTASRLQFMTDRAEAIRTAVGSAVAPMAIVCMLVALGLAWGLGRFWVDKRRAEVRLLFVRGVAPGVVGAKAAVEMLVPGLLGVVVGWLLASVAIRGLGPSDRFDPGVVVQGLGLSLLAFAVGLLAVVAAVWRRAAKSMEPEATMATSRRFRVPVLWEIAALGGAWLAWRRLSTEGVPAATADLAPPVDVLALLFPVLFLAGGLGLAARVLKPVFRLLRLRGRWLPAAPYLAVRRLAAEHSTALLLVGVSALAIGVVTYGSGLVRSTETTADAKSKVEAGGDVWVGVVPPSGETTPPLPGRSTIMGFDSKSTFAGQKVSVRVVDPATLADGAFWDASFADESLDVLLGRLTDERDDGAIPVLAVGDTAAEGTIERLGNLKLGMQLSVMGRAETFPTVGGSEPTLIMAVGRIDGYEDILERRVLARDATAEELGAALDDGDWGIGSIVERNDLRDSSVYLPTIWTFGFVRALGIVVALLAVAALLVYVDTRQRRRAVAAALLARMGVPPWRHWRALLAELGVLTALSLVIGTALGWFAVRAVSEHLDAAPDLPPGPLLRYPSVTTAALTAAAIAIVTLAASWAQRAALRTNLGEALREDV